MKKYNRAQEKRNDLNSVINYTTSSADGNAAKKNTREGPKGKSEGSKTSGNAFEHDRDYDGKRKYKPGRSGQKNRSPKVQCEQDYEAKISSKSRFPGKDRRKHRARGRTENQDDQRIIEGDLS